jgi:hypothetical protein
VAVKAQADAVKKNARLKFNLEQCKKCLWLKERRKKQISEENLSAKSIKIAGYQQDKSVAGTIEIKKHDYERSLDLHKGNVDKLQSDSVKVRAEVRCLEESNMELNDRLIKFQEIVANTGSRIINTKCKTRYIEPVRKSVAFCIRSQVPLEHATSVVAYITKQLCNVEYTSLPSRGTTRNISVGINVMSSKQAVESMINSCNVNIAWDATTIRGKHYN